MYVPSGEVTPMIGTRAPTAMCLWRSERSRAQGRLHSWGYVVVKFKVCVGGEAVIIRYSGEPSRSIVSTVKPAVEIKVEAVNIHYSGGPSRSIMGTTKSTVWIGVEAVNILYG